MVYSVHRCCSLDDRNGFWAEIPAPAISEGLFLEHLAYCDVTPELLVSGSDAVECEIPLAVRL